MAKAKKRRARKRKPVSRSERVGPPPEAAQHYRPWPMQDLLRKGPDDGGLSSGEFEAALQIVEAFRIITHGLGYKPTDLARVGIGGGELGPRSCRLWNVYVDWGNAFQRRALVAPHVIAEMVEDERPIDAGAVWLVAMAGEMWDRACSNYDRAQRAERDRVGICA